MQGMKHGKIKIDKTEYVTKGEVFEHAHYILSCSKSLLLDYFLEHHPRFFRALNGGVTLTSLTPTTSCGQCWGDWDFILQKDFEKSKYQRV